MNFLHATYVVETSDQHLVTFLIKLLIFKFKDSELLHFFRIKF